jgi:hypothetical protein
MIAIIILSLVFGLHIFGSLCRYAPSADGDGGMVSIRSGLAGSLAAGALAVVVLAVIGGV